jgi:hypothetical protein
MFRFVESVVAVLVMSMIVLAYTMTGLSEAPSGVRRAATLLSRKNISDRLDVAKFINVSDAAGLGFNRPA